jgi:hypothetical protein
MLGQCVEYRIMEVLSFLFERNKRTFANLSVGYSFKTLTVLFSEEMAKAYDFALEKVGLDISANSIYLDYVAFLKAV